MNVEPSESIEPLCEEEAQKICQIQCIVFLSLNCGAVELPQHIWLRCLQRCIANLEEGDVTQRDIRGKAAKSAGEVMREYRNCSELISMTPLP
ncbi:MAG: hypothetical protein A3I05_01405 [Deltaproteobacteria bacterium RIFCSPLOWO2_02_FULL_44_10]|nr:MAG: hypothetical protein A3C46_00650 [Deltaproteobacteria bacterium RIFCSPHIGHO2_02_FULL_44_16]OGQ46969.1 MAG: hypothetical protein A3I05_01405 [Deltaproteobacteria bacterium RIFCSPLOWO2_02_FULL_44_10]